jgi:hypothetical protein
MITVHGRRGPIAKARRGRSTGAKSLAVSRCRREMNRLDTGLVLECPDAGAQCRRLVDGGKKCGKLSLFGARQANCRSHDAPKVPGSKPQWQRMAIGQCYTLPAQPCEKQCPEYEGTFVHDAVCAKVQIKVPHVTSGSQQFVRGGRNFFLLPVPWLLVTAAKLPRSPDPHASAVCPCTAKRVVTGWCVQEGTVGSLPSLPNEKPAACSRCQNGSAQSRRFFFVHFGPADSPAWLLASRPEPCEDRNVIIL